jgi:hypothetical protein
VLGLREQSNSRGGVQGAQQGGRQWRDLCVQR